MASVILFLVHEYLFDFFMVGISSRNIKSKYFQIIEINYRGGNSRDCRNAAHFRVEFPYGDNPYYVNLCNCTLFPCSLSAQMIVVHVGWEGNFGSCGRVLYTTKKERSLSCMVVTNLLKYVIKNVSQSKSSQLYKGKIQDTAELVLSM